MVLDKVEDEVATMIDEALEALNSYSEELEELDQKVRDQLLELASLLKNFSKAAHALHFCITERKKEARNFSAIMCSLQKSESSDPAEVLSLYAQVSECVEDAEDLMSTYPEEWDAFVAQSTTISGCVTEPMSRAAYPTKVLNSMIIEVSEEAKERVSITHVELLGGSEARELFILTPEGLPSSKIEPFSHADGLNDDLKPLICSPRPDESDSASDISDPGNSHNRNSSENSDGPGAGLNDEAGEQSRNADHNGIQEEKEEENDNQEEKHVELRIVAKLSRGAEEYEVGKMHMVRMRKGFEFKRINRVGRGKMKLFWMTTALDRLYWGIDKRHKKGPHLIKSLESVDFGKKGGNSAEMLWGTKKFLIEAENEQELKQFVDGLLYSKSIYTPYPDELPDDIQLESLVSGTEFFRHSPSTKPLPLTFWMSDSLDRIFWAKSRTDRENGMIFGVMLTLTIKQVLDHSIEAPNDPNGFAIVGLQGSQLDVSAHDASTKEQWTKTLQFLVSQL